MSASATGVRPSWVDLSRSINTQFGRDLIETEFGYRSLTPINITVITVPSSSSRAIIIAFSPT